MIDDLVGYVLHADRGGHRSCCRRRPIAESPRSSCHHGPHPDLRLATHDKHVPFLTRRAVRGWEGALKWSTGCMAAHTPHVADDWFAEDVPFLRSLVEMEREQPGGPLPFPGDVADRA